MASPMSWRVFKRKFARYGVEIGPPRRGSHHKLRKVIDREVRTYTVPVSKGKVDAVYVKAARKAFDLLPEKNVSDEDFDAA